MGRQSSGVRGGLQPNDSSYKGKVLEVETLKNIKSPQVYKEVSAAIGRYDSVMGVRQREVKLANLSAGTLGVHVTVNGKSDAVYLNKDRFNQSKSAIVAQTRKGYESGWHTKTNKPIAHTVTHELAHATWNSHLTSPQAQAASKAINGLYKGWLQDRNKKGYGQYAKTNVNEFWAETVTKAVHGVSDKYTRAVKKIAKKYKL